MVADLHNIKLLPEHLAVNWSDKSVNVAFPTFYWLLKKSLFYLFPLAPQGQRQFNFTVFDMQGAFKSLFFRYSFSSRNLLCFQWVGFLGRFESLAYRHVRRFFFCAVIQ